MIPIRRCALMNGKLQVKNVALDMSTENDINTAIESISDTTHLVFCAFSSTGDSFNDVEVNFGMFKQLVEASEAAGLKLKHVHFISGTKW
jgi:hypothetical protein